MAIKIKASKFLMLCCFYSKMCYLCTLQLFINFKISNIMKKVLMLSLALILGIGANAQIKYGVKAGLNLSNLSVLEATHDGESRSEDLDKSMSVGFHAGGFANFSFGQYVGLQPELLFSMQGGKFKKGEYKASYTFDYINVPVLVDIKPFANFSILAGPQIGFNIYKSATEEYEGESETTSGSEFDEVYKNGDKKFFKGFDFAAVVGLQYTFIEHLTVGARYNIGLTNSFIDDNDEYSEKGWKNSVIQVSVGWTF
jgi:opacity protein-like surface antigen